MFSPSEQGFLYGLAIICCISLTVKYGTLIIFNKTLSAEDAKLLESGKGGEVSKRTVILAGIYFIANLTLFMNSAILIATLIKGYFL